MRLAYTSIWHNKYFINCANKFKNSSESKSKIFDRILSKTFLGNIPLFSSVTFSTLVNVVAAKVNSKIANINYWEDDNIRSILFNCLGNSAYNILAALSGNSKLIEDITPNVAAEARLGKAVSIPVKLNNNHWVSTWYAIRVANIK